MLDPDGKLWLVTDMASKLLTLTYTFICQQNTVPAWTMLPLVKPCFTSGSRGWLHHHGLGPRSTSRRDSPQCPSQSDP